MTIKEIKLNEIYPELKDSDGILTLYLPEDNEYISQRDFVLVCPGGGYGYISPREGEIVALRFICEGFAAGVIKYTINHTYPTPHLDLGASIKYIRSHKEEFNITNNVSIVGFSAGGHLVCSFGFIYKEIADLLKVNKDLLRPDVIISGYPVISSHISDHSRTFTKLTNGDKELLQKLCVEDNVTSDYPPSFVYTTRTDSVIDYRNSELYVEALKKHGVKYEYHLYESGEHGASLANRSVYPKGHIELEKTVQIKDWVTLASNFIYSVIDK